jgi:hypothetical protein
MGTEETKDTVPSRNKQTPPDASVTTTTTTSKTTTTTTSDLKIEEEEEENVIIVPKNQQQSLVPASANDVNSDTNIQEYSERTTLVKEEEEEEEGEKDYTRLLSVKARRAEEALSDLLDSLGTKAEATVRKKFDELDKALDDNYTSAVLDSRKIKELGPMVKEIAEAFEGTMTMIEKVPYEEQIILFQGYKKLVEEEIKVVDSRIDMTERLK